MFSCTYFLQFPFFNVSCIFYSNNILVSTFSSCFTFYNNSSNLSVLTSVSKYLIKSLYYDIYYLKVLLSIDVVFKYFGFGKIYFFYYLYNYFRSLATSFSNYSI